MDINKIPIGENPPWDINVIIEIPLGGSPIKYELDKESGALFVNRFLHTSMQYPANYGFIPHTLSEDGDPNGRIGCWSSTGCGGLGHSFAPHWRLANGRRSRCG